MIKRRQREREREREHADRVRDYVPRPIELRSDEIVNGVVGLIGTYSSNFTTRFTDLMRVSGNTPLVRINSLSDALGVEILVSSISHR